MKPHRGPSVLSRSFNSVKVFSADDRAQVDKLVEVWLAANPQILLLEAVVTESTTSAGSCVCMTLFYYEAVVPLVVALSS